MPVQSRNCPQTIFFLDMEEEGTTQVDIPAAVNTRVSLQVQARITFGSLIQLRV